MTESTIFCSGARLILESGGKLSIQEIWRSFHYGHRVAAVAAAVAWKSASPARRTAMIDWNKGKGPVQLRAEWEPGRVSLTATTAGSGETARAVVKLNTEEQGS